MPLYWAKNRRDQWPDRSAAKATISLREGDTPSASRKKVLCKYCVQARENLDSFSSPREVAYRTRRHLATCKHAPEHVRRRALNPIPMKKPKKRTNLVLKHLFCGKNTKNRGFLQHCFTGGLSPSRTIMDANKSAFPLGMASRAPIKCSEVMSTDCALFPDGCAEQRIDLG